MPPLAATIDVDSPEFARRRAAAASASEQLRARLERARAGGGERSTERHHARGKLTARERLVRLADRDEPLLELSELAAEGMYDDRVPGAGIVTSVAWVEGRPCMVVANDATVLGGTYFPASVRKHLRAQELAASLGLTCVYLVDSGGAHLPLQSELFADRDHGGRMFYNQAAMTARGIAQIACVMGSCTAGGAYVPAMSQETVIVRGTGTVFLGGPPLVLAATGERVTAQELGGADVHTRISGLADHIAEDDAHALDIVRSIVAEVTPAVAAPAPTSEDTAPPAMAPELVEGLVPVDAADSLDMRAVLATLLDASALHEFKAGYGPQMLCGFGAIGGTQLAVLANVAQLDDDALAKATHLVELCCQRRMPLLVVQDQPVLAAGCERAAGRLLAVLSCAEVPTVTMVVRPGSADAEAAMGGRDVTRGLRFSWPHGEALQSTARLHDDGVVAPAGTRRLLRLALALMRHAPAGPSRFGVLRM